MKYGFLVLLTACSGGSADKETGVPLEGPALVHVVPGAVVEGADVELSVTATDADGVAAVTLYHRVSGETSWSQEPMVQGEDDTWTVTLTDEDVDYPSVEYYFKGVDSGDLPANTYLPVESTSAPYALTVNVIGVGLPFVEGFEHADDDSLSDLGWSNASLGFHGYSWESTQSKAYEGERSAFHSRGHTDVSGLDDWLVSPALDMRDVPTAQVTWQELGLNVAVANHGLYASVGSRDPNDGDYVAVEAALPAPGLVWGRSAIYDLSAYAGEPAVYLAWRFIGDEADDWYVDDVRVTELQADLVIDTTAEPSPIGPGDAGTFTVSVDNVGIVAADALSVAVSFPYGGASVAESTVEIAGIAAGSAGSADFSLSVDAASCNNCYVPVDVTLSSGGTTWSASDNLLVGLASTAVVEVSPVGSGNLELVLGVGDPDAPTWSETLYDADLTDTIELSVDITDQWELLPPSAGDLRWWLRATSEGTATVDSFSIWYDGIEYAATVLPVVDVDGATVWLPEPPALDVVVTSSPATLSPGDSDISLGLYVTNYGEATQGAVLASLWSDDPDVTVTDAGPVALTADVLAAGARADVSGLFAFDVSSSHIDSSSVSLMLTLDDGVESWDSAVSLDVPYPYLRVSVIDIDDDDRSGTIDPGETSEISLQIINVGDLATDGALTATLTAEASSTASVSVSDNVESYRELSPGRSDDPDDPWTIVVDGGADGDSIDLLLTLTDNLRSYEVRTTVRLGEPPWEELDPTGDADDDALDGSDFDVIGGQWRVDDGVLSLRLQSADTFDADQLFIEAWGYSTVADWTYYRLVLQSGVAKLQGYDSGFTNISTPVVSYPSDTEVQFDITIADMGLALNALSLGFAAGWCGPDEYYCDHFPDGWGYPYDTWSPSLFFDLAW